jgi:glycosyltransferase involved in cell wall biosynthesis
MIDFTIITPVFNREDCIGRCIESVIMQNYPAIEYWIVNDGSTDKTGEIVEAYVKRYPYIKYHKFKKNKGTNAARNYAIQNGTGDFIIFLDSDDRFTENALDTICKQILSHPGYLNYLFAQDDRIDFYNRNLLLNKTGNKPIELQFQDFLSGKVSGDFAHVISLMLIQQFPFDEQLRIYEALNFLRIFKAGKKQLFFNQIVVTRERGRFDSVSKESLMYNKKALENQYTALKETIFLFAGDYLNFHAKDVLYGQIKRVYILSTALGYYRKNKQLETFTKKLGLKIPGIYRIMDRLRLGYLLWMGILGYSFVKNKFVQLS